MSLAIVQIAAAQPKASAKIPQVGVCLFPEVPTAELTSLSHPLAGMLASGLRERGWEDGKNVRLLFWSAVGTGGPLYEIRPCIDAFIKVPVDVLVLPVRTEYALEKSRSIPVVGIYLDPDGKRDPNLTGIARQVNAVLNSKRLALLTEATKARRVVFAYAKAPSPQDRPGLGSEKDFDPALQAAARDLKVTIVPLDITAADQIEPAFSALADGRTAVLIGDSTLWAKWNAVHILRDSLLKYRLPSMVRAAEPARHGFMMGYGPTYVDALQRMPYFIDRILRGAKPADLPVEQVNKYPLAINMEVARKIGVTIAPSVVLQADTVFERIEPIVQ